MFSRIIKRVWPLLVALTLAAGGVPPAAQGATPVPVSLETVSTSVAGGDTVTLQIKVGPATGLYAADLRLTYDPARLQILDQDAAKQGVQAADFTGGLLRPDFVVQNSAGAGAVQISYTQLAPSAAVTGPGLLATVRATALAAGSTTLSFSQTPILSNADGQSIPAQGVPLTLTITGSGGSVPGAVNAAASGLTATSPVLADGTATSQITVTLRDAASTPLTGRTVQLAVSGSGNTLSGVTEQGNGVYTATLKSTAAGTKTVSATGDGVALAQTAAVVFTAPAVPNAATVSVSLAPSPSPATVGQPVTLQVELGAVQGLFGAEIRLSYDPARLQFLDQDGSKSGVQAADFTGGLLQPDLVVVNSAAAGAVEFAVTQLAPTPDAVGPGVLATLRATALTAGDTTVGFSQTPLLSDRNGVALPSQGVPLTLTIQSSGGTVPGPVSATVSTVTATSPVVADNTAASQITVTVRDAAGTPLPGKPVQLAVTGAGNTLSAVADQGGGVYTATLRSTVAETKTVSATADGVALQQTATVVFTDPSGGSGTVAVTLVPTLAALTTGQQTSVQVQLGAVQGLYAAELHLTYDPALLQFADLNAAQNGVQPADLTGGLLQADFVQANTAANGVLTLAFTQLAPAAPVSGSGLLATFQVTALAAGSATIGFAQDPILSTADGQRLSAQGQPVTLTISSPPISGGGGGGGGGSSSPPPPPPPTGGTDSVNSQTGGTLVLGDITITIPQGATETPTTLTVRVATSTTSGTPDLPDGTTAGTRAFTVDLYDANGQKVTEFAAAIEITVPYTDADLALVGGDPSLLRLYRFDETSQTWQSLEVTVDPVTRTLRARTQLTSLFTIVADLPPPVSLGGPPNGLVVGLGAVLTWTSPAGTAQYHIQVVPYNGDGPAVNMIIGAAELVAASRYELPAPVRGRGPYALLPGMSYTWRVRTSPLTTPLNENSPGWSRFAEASFRTSPPTSITIAPQSPAPNTTISEARPLLQWRDLNPQIYYYELQLSQDATFTTDPAAATAAVYWELVHGGETVPVNSYRVKEAYQLEPGTYYWRVRPRVQGDGAPVGWSERWSFTVQ